MTQKQLIDQFCEFRGKCTTNDVVALNFAYEMLMKSQWISVEEDLPKDGEYVLICNKRGLMTTSLYENEEWVISETYIAVDVTHWMPLPAPPHHIIDANKKVDRVVGTADHIKTALDVMKKGGEK